MFTKTCSAIISSAENKVRLLDSNPLGYIVSSMLAGMFVTLGGLVALTMQALAANAGDTAPKLIGAFLFSSALCLVITAGSELFTGNNLVMAMASLDKRFAWSKTFKLWIVCWLGNLLGSVLTVVMYKLSGAGNGEVIAKAFAASAAAKIAYTPVEMVFRGIFCNICVCLATWVATRIQDDCAKLIMSIFCIMIFMICGFEHVVANMSIILIGLLNPMGEVVTVLGFLKNLLFVTIGNVLGGAVFVALPYWYITNKKNGSVRSSVGN